MYRVRFGDLGGLGGTTDRVEKQVNRMGETGSRGKEGRDDARWEDDLLLVGYIHFFFCFFQSLLARAASSWACWDELVERHEDA